MKIIFQTDNRLAVFEVTNWNLNKDVKLLDAFGTFFKSGNLANIFKSMFSCHMNPFTHKKIFHLIRQVRKCHCWLKSPFHFYQVGDVNESKSNMTGGLQLAKSYRSSCSSSPHIQIRKFITGREDKRFISQSLLQDKSQS